MQTPPIVRDVVLLGGGHAHVIVIRMWAMKQIPGVRLTLVSQDAMTPYSGMLPGLVAGHYSFRDSHIDLNQLCRWARVRFVQATVTGLAPDKRRVHLQGRPDIEYDILSIDTGGAPNLDTVEGARAHTTPVKPVHQFWARWQKIEQRAIASREPIRIGVVGGGAGGFEILLAMHFRLNHAGDGPRHSFHWIYRSEMLADFTDRVRDMAKTVCVERKITLHPQFDVRRVDAGMLISANDEKLGLDEILWCTEAAAARWPAGSGLACDDRGFITTDDCLQSMSHPGVFAAGDVSIQVNHPRPRAGVFAVRQGPVLFRNLQRAAVEESLQPHYPQQRFLTLLSLGRQSAIAQRGSLSVRGDWVWRWKDWIDRRFMNRFSKLPAQPQMPLAPLPVTLERALDHDSQAMRCGGCGAKVAGDVLAQALDNLSVIDRADVVSGLGSRDDIAIIDPGDRLVAQSVDQIRSLIDDPWLFARIATLHALSDLYASASHPQSALLVLGLPHAQDSVTRRELYQVLDGVVSTLNECGCALTGGHTSEAAELTVGLVVNGFIDKVSADSAVFEPGNYDLILTKPLGSGVVMAADMRGLASWSMVEGCLDNMLRSNRQAGDVLGEFAAALTDVTGFGLVGHLEAMLKNIPGEVALLIDQIPALTGAIELAEQGIRSSLYEANARPLGRIGKKIQETGMTTHPVYPLLFDPQTSGGLLGLVPSVNTAGCLDALHAVGDRQARVIGGMIVEAVKTG